MKSVLQSQTPTLSVAMSIIASNPRVPTEQPPTESQFPLPDTHDDFTGMAWNRHEFQGAGVGSNESPGLPEWHRNHQDAQVPQCVHKLKGRKNRNCSPSVSRTFEEEQLEGLHWDGKQKRPQ